MSTLRYADQAKSIVNTVKVNEDPFARTVRRLKDEASDNAETKVQNGLISSTVGRMAHKTRKRENRVYRVAAPFQRAWFGRDSRPV